MSGFLDRLAARALGEAPLVHPRLRSRFEPDAAGTPAAPVETVEEGAVGAAPPAPVPRAERVDRVEVVERVEPVMERRLAAPPEETFESERPRRERIEAVEPLVRRVVPEERPVRVEPPVVDSPEPVGERRRLSPHPPAPSPALPLPRPGEGETLRERFPRDLERVVAPPLPGGGSEGGRGGRGVRTPAPQLPETLRLLDRPLPPDIAVPESESRPLPRERAEASEPPPPLRPTVRSRLAETVDLPTVEPSRGAPPLPAFAGEAESEPSETVIRIDIGRIDVRAPQAPAPERRPAGPARPAGPRLTLSDYLKRRREGRR